MYIFVCFFSVLKNTVFEISLWCNNYINRVDKSVKVVTEDLLRWHAVFYSICQALFYIISFKHQDLMDCKKSKLLHNCIMYFTFSLSLIFNNNYNSV